MTKHPNTIAGVIALFVFCGIFLQLILMIQAPSSDSILEVIIRFFSYFTILSNLIVFVHFFSKALSAELGEVGFWTKPETSTAVTVYICVVGLVYHLVLSSIHNPQGLAKIADHGLHSFTPLVTLLYWVVFLPNKKIKYLSIPYWLIYPALYFVYTIIHGVVSQFYPYPFLDVGKIGLVQTFLNCLVVLILFTFLSLLLSIFANFRYKKLNPPR